MIQGITVGRLARQHGLARSTLLYYDRQGLLSPSLRTGANYRLYSQADVDRLEKICFYRRMGIPVAQISNLIARSRGTSQEILERRLAVLNAEIATRREQEQQILRLLSQFPKTSRQSHSAGRTGARASGGTGGKFSQESPMVSKERWIQIMRAAGFSDQAMMQWHQTFEKMEPQAHQEFLESLKISKDEIAQIRKAAQQ